MEFDECKCPVVDYRGKLPKIIAKGIREDGLYRLCAGKATHKSLITHKQDMVDLWHKRMGHLKMQCLKHAKKVVLGLQKLNIEKGKLCEGCALGKHRRLPFPRSDKKASKVLELVHSDICGPMSIESFGGSLYFLLLMITVGRLGFTS